MTAPILVGIAADGRSAAAVRWAADEAHASGRPLHLVRALVLPAGRVPGAVFAGIDAHRGLRALAERDVADMAREAREAAPGLPIETAVVEGPTITVLRARARGADLLVLGSDGLGPVTDLVLGGIARGVCGHVPVPVVIVPEKSDPEVRNRASGRAPVVVGDDGTPGSYRAFLFAAERAHARGAPLVVIRAGHRDDVPRDGLLARPAGPPVEVLVAHDRADRVLVDRSLDAELVVLGVGAHDRWHHHRARTRPGVVLRATCPVAVVPPLPLTDTVPTDASVGETAHRDSSARTR